MRIPDLTAPIEDGFEARVAAVHETADYYGINAQNAIVIGSAALALHGIDAHVHDRFIFGSAFDLDVLLSRDCPADDPLRDLSRESVEIYKNERAPLELTLIGGQAAEDFPVLALGYPDVDTMMADRVQIGDLTTLSVRGLIRAKENRGDIKDRAGIIQAHLRATVTRHEVVDDHVWQEVIHATVDKLTAQNSEDKTGHFSPEIEQFPWLAELLKRNFVHPAFAQKKTTGK